MFHRQFVSALAVIVAAMIFGGTQARAGYVSVPALADHEGGNSLVHLPASPLGEFDSSISMGGSAASSPSRPDTDIPQVPFGPVAPARKLPPVAWNFGHHSGTGTSSNSGSGNGPSPSTAGDLPRPQVPPLELSSLLPPQTGEEHPFSVASFLFRPPRAA